MLLGGIISNWFFPPVILAKYDTVLITILLSNFAKLFMNMGNPFIHSLSYTYILGSLTALTKCFFWGSFLGNFEIVFVSCFSFLTFGPFQCSVGHCHSLNREKCALHFLWQSFCWQNEWWCFKICFLGNSHKQLIFPFLNFIFWVPLHCVLVWIKETNAMGQETTTTTSTTTTTTTTNNS